MLKRIMPYLSKPTAKLVYNTTIAPIFDYCGVVWKTCSDTSATKVQKLQNRAARQIIGVSNGIHPQTWLFQTVSYVNLISSISIEREEKKDKFISICAKFNDVKVRASLQCCGFIGDIKLSVSSDIDIPFLQYELIHR